MIINPSSYTLSVIIPCFNEINTIEEVCIQCVENGSMTKDLAILVGPSSKYLTTNQFLDVIDSNLKKRLN